MYVLVWTYYRLKAYLMSMIVSDIDDMKEYIYRNNNSRRLFLFLFSNTIIIFIFQYYIIVFLSECDKYIIDSATVYATMRLVSIANVTFHTRNTYFKLNYRHDFRCECECPMGKLHRDDERFVEMTI